MNSANNPCLRSVLLWGALCAALLPAACGKRGPLYLPDQTGVQAKSGEPAAKPVPSEADAASGKDNHQK